MVFTTVQPAKSRKLYSVHPVRPQPLRQRAHHRLVLRAVTQENVGEEFAGHRLVGLRTRGDWRTDNGLEKRDFVFTIGADDMVGIPSKADNRQRIVFARLPIKWVENAGSR